MTLRELLQSVDAEAYASVPLYEKLLKTKPEYGSSNRFIVQILYLVACSLFETASFSPNNI